MYEYREALIKRAGQAALDLSNYLNVLLDAFDFYAQRYPASTKSELFVLADLQVSIKALSTLPMDVANHLQSWQCEAEPALTRLGFEVNILNEFSMHMFSVEKFMHQKSIDLSEKYNARAVSRAFETLRNANKLLINLRAT